jgi:rubredoxin
MLNREERLAEIAATWDCPYCRAGKFVLMDPYDGGTWVCDNCGCGRPERMAWTRKRDGDA